MLEVVNEVRLTLKPNQENPYLKGAFDFGRMFFFKWYVFILHACR